MKTTINGSFLESFKEMERFKKRTPFYLKLIRPLYLGAQMKI